MRRLVLLIGILALHACNREAPMPSTTQQVAPPPASQAAPPPVAQPAPAPVPQLAQVAAPAVGNVPAAGAVNQSDPVAVVAAVFAAAQSGQYAPLASLCAPGCDGDTRRICAVASDPSLAAEFQRYFATGRVTGPAVVTGTTATVPITFGPDGTSAEQMQLAQVGGQWFLMSF